jgi:hypothetical protein
MSDADKARIRSLESEKHHLEIISAEYLSFKDKYKLKCDQLEDKISILN